MLGLYLLWFSSAVSVGALVVGVAYAVRPTERKLALMRPLSLSTIFAALASLAAGAAYVLTAASRSGRLPADRLMMAGADVLVPIFASFSVLAAAWLIVAIGSQRQV